MHWHDWQTTKFVTVVTQNSEHLAQAARPNQLIGARDDSSNVAATQVVARFTNKTVRANGGCLDSKRRRRT